MADESKPPKALWWLLGLGALVRLALIVNFADVPIYQDDEADYNELAVCLVERGAFCNKQGDLLSQRPPLYPVFVAACYRLFGIEAYQSVRAAQAVLSLLTVILVYRLGAQLYSKQVGLAAAGCFCFYPSLLVFNNLLLTECLFTFLLTAACVCGVRAFKGVAISPFAAMGLLLGLGALTRSVIWLFPPVLSLFILLVGKMPLGRRILAVLALCIPFAATLAPWAIRNTRLQQTLTVVDVMGGRNFMMGNYEFTPLHRSWAAISIDGKRAWHQVLAAESGTLKGMTQGQIDKLAMRAGFKFVLANPRLTLQRDFVKFLDFWQLERLVVAGAARGRFGPMSRAQVTALAVVVVGGYVICFLSAVFGAIVAPPVDWRSHLLLLLVMAFVCALHTLVFGHSRYHLPLIPIISVYSGAAYVNLGELWRQRRTRRMAAACALIIGAAGAWGYELISSNLGALRSLL